MRRLTPSSGAVLIAIATVLATPFDAKAEDLSECKQRFIECVQKTGNPLTCHAVSAACSTQMAPGAKSVTLSERVAITQREGLAYARMTIENTGSEPTEISVRAWGVACPDGSRETLYFLFNGAALAPQGSLVSHEVVACFGQSSAKADAAAPETAPPATTHSGSFFCDLDGAQPVEIKVIGEALVKYKRWDGVQGTRRVRTADGTDLFDFVCESVTPAEMTLQQKARDAAAPYLKPFMARMIEALGLTASGYEKKYGTTGVRG